VSELYYPELTSTGYFLTGLAEGLAESHKVRVLSGQPSYWARGMRAPAREMRHGVDIKRCWATTLDKNIPLFKIINMLTISISIFISALRCFRNNDIVIAVTNPPLLPYLASVACRARRAHFILLVHDVYPEVLSRLGVLKPRSMSESLLNLASRRLYESTSRIIVLGRDMQKIVSRKLSSGQDRISVATNWASTEAISPQVRSKNKLLNKLKLDDKFVVQFWGNMGRPHCIDDLVDAAQLLASDPAIHFLLIGWGTKKSWAIKEKQVRGLENLTILDPPPREDSSDVQNACDVAINALVSGMTGISVPSRTYNAMAAGKPVLAVCDPESELATMVNEEGIGWVVPPGRPDLIAAILRNARHDQDALEGMSGRARRAVDAKYTRDHVLQIYQRIIGELGFK
jgi:colanic acid biosynthesis glycosyl transferase WcaI